MLTVASLLVAMTIAGAFWVGVLAARRLRDWGEGRRALEEGHTPAFALAAASGAPPDDPGTRRVRALVADRLASPRAQPGAVAPRQLMAADAGGRSSELGVGSLRQGDVVVVEAADASADGDYLVEGVVLLREGNRTTTVLNLADGSRRRWLVGGTHLDEWFVVEPVVSHGLSGEPPRNIRRERGDFTLQRRGQASAACTGRHERPEQPRVATYLYGGASRSVLWLERWGHEVLMAEGTRLDAGSVSFLPGS
jgi:hypothetical protein